ncbi:MAG TPA: EamA family transporter [Acidobacteriaceae bacterium]|nr:EamA family transporter [Acidobacteriaceae bacterium]
MIAATMSRRGARSALGYAACALAGGLWGTGFFFGKIAMREMSSAHMVFYRFLFACVGLAPVLLSRRPGLNAREWRILLIAAFLGVPVQFLLQFAGLARTTVSHAALMVGTLPVVLAVGAGIFAHERLDRISWTALAASTTGAALIALGGSHHSSGGNAPTLTGDLMIVISLMISLVWILMNQRLLRNHSPLVVTAYGLSTGSVMLAVWVFAVDGPPPMPISRAAWLALAASGLLCTASTTLLWNWGLTRVPASRAGVFLNLEPLIGSLLGVGLLGEHLGPAAWLGGSMILTAAITLTSRPHSHAGDERLVA